MIQKGSSRGVIRGRSRAFSKLCAFVFSGVFLSTVIAGTADAAWISNGPYSKVIKDVSVAPDNPSIRYAAAFGSGVFRTLDGGATWELLKSGMTNTYTRSVLAVSSLEVFAGTNDGVFQSLDSGSTWTMVLPTTFSVRALARDPITGKLYAGTFGSDLYVSAAGGGLGTWTLSVVRDDTTGVILHHIRSIAVFGQDSLYAGGSIGDIPTGGALFASYNGGLSWVQLQRGTGIRSTVMDIAISPNNPAASLIIGTAIRGAFKTTGGGAPGTWTSINGDLTLNPLADTNTSCVVFTPDYRMVGTDSTGNLYRRMLGDSTNGIGWIAAVGLPGMTAPVTQAWADPSGAEILVGTAGQGVSRSLDSGRTFIPANNGMLGTAVRAVAFGNSGRIIVGTGFGDGIWYSDDNGTSWSQAALPTSNSVTALGETATPSILFAGVYATGVLKSTDNGQTWLPTDTAVINRFVRSLAVVPGSSSIVYAGTGNGVFKTIDGGTTWTDVNGLDIPFSTSIRSLAVSPLNANIILAGSDIDYLYRSTNAGVSWTHINTANGFGLNDAYIRSLEFDPSAPGRVYAGSDSGHVYISTDDGTTWSLLSALPATHSVRAIKVHPARPSEVFAATFGNGLFVSEDGGVTWSNISGSLPDSQLYTLKLDPVGLGANLYVGTRRNSLFYESYSGIPPLACNASRTPGSGPPPLVVQFTANASGGIPPYAYSWDFGDGGNSTQQNPLYTYQILGLKTATLTVTDSLLETCQSIVQVYVGTCSCPFQGDLDGNGFTDPVDLSSVIDIVFFGGTDLQDPGCPTTRADVNGSGSVDPVDLSSVIDLIFFGGASPVDPCNP